MKRVYICLVSDQPIPNMIPVFMDQFLPDEIILINTRDKAIQSERLSEIFKAKNIKVYEERTDSMDYTITSNIVKKITEDFRDSELILNITGGTKMMSLGAFEAFITAKHNPSKILYVDTQNRVVREIYPSNNQLKFSESITLEDYLKSYGYVVERSSDPNRYDYRLENDLKDNINNLIEFSGYINRLINYSVRGSFKIRPDKSLFTNKSFVSVIRLFEKYGYLSIKDYKLDFQTTENFQFITGGWLEYYVYKKIAKILNKNKNLLMNAVLTANGFCNEVDVIFVYMNQLYLVECKSGKWDRNFFKIETLIRNMGGTFGKAMLVAFGEVSSVFKKRILNSGIELIGRDKIDEFDQIFSKWIRKEETGH